MSYSILTENTLSTSQFEIKDSHFNASLSPNPTREISYISVTTNKAEKINIRLFNTFGQQVGNLYEGTVDNTLNLAVPTNKLGPGCYVLKVESPTDRRIIKFLKL